jgi:hypothetical protein
MKRIFSLCALLAIFAAAAFADVRLPDTPKPTPAPKEKKTIDTNFRINIQKDAKEARLLIPKDQIKELRAQLDELDGGSSTAGFLSFSRAQTIAGGLFLSLAFVFGGVWFARSRKTGLKPNRAVMAGAVLFFCGAFAAIAFANMGPPPEARSITGKMFAPAVHVYKMGWGRVKVEMSDDDEIQLIVPDVPDDKKTAE